MLGLVSIVQSKESPSGSSIVILNAEVLMSTPVAPLLGLGPENTGALFVSPEPPIGAIYSAALVLRSL